MKKLAMLLGVMCLAGCVPKEAIVPNYNGPDAVTLFFFNHKWTDFQQYIEMDDEIITTLVADDQVVVKVAPGQHVMHLKPEASGKPIPHKTNLQPGTTHYFDINRVGFGFFQFQEVSQADFDRLLKEADVRTFKTRMIFK